MTAAVFAYSRRGCETARRAAAALPDAGARLFAAARLTEDGFAPIPQPSRTFYGDLFAACDALVFVGSCGIAVRMIAPFVRDKKTDPAVIVIDERGRFVIPLLSGHIGGANALAQRLADALGATGVITTATDINGRFSVDAWAARRGWVIGDMAAAKHVSAAILEGDVPLCSEFPLRPPLPGGVTEGAEGPLGIYVGCRMARPFSETLRIIPRALHLGIGCRRGTPEAAIADAVGAVLEEHGIDPRALKCAASIDLKRDEQGLLAYAETAGLPISFYPADALAALEGDFTPSDFVRSVTGVDSVCERAAMMGAAALLVRKTAKNGVTVALAAENLEVSFE